MSKSLPEAKASILNAVASVMRPNFALQSAPILDEDIDGVREVALHDAFGHNPVYAFEASLRRVTDADYAIAVSSGTAALHLALIAAGVKPGDEVICPTLTFAATANAIVHCGAIPHFVDVCTEDFGINNFKLQVHLQRGAVKFKTPMNTDGERTIAAIVPVHLLGAPCQIQELIATASHWGVPVIEDAAEALGSKRGGACGTFGLAGIISFNLNKIVTTGGGGAVLTRDLRFAHEVRHLATNAKVPHRYLWDHDAVGWNYRMPNFCAAFGMRQLWRFEETLKRKRSLAGSYANAFKDNPFATHVAVFGSNYWLNAIRLHTDVNRDAIIEALLDKGYEARALFTPLHMLPHFKDCPRQKDLRVAEHLFDTTVCLPSSIGGEK